ncbi:hypothetical protein C2845_PM01G43240 [Panicum miliaceum]|uniref:WAT1-related protein n=1 Tax=Panicum miliaceum TaxID=4540 RepID=A0A3L6THA5_PANMI|nr:hypothetical protein C2845_PM01G43240 [Panicum miliaceum]
MDTKKPYILAIMVVAIYTGMYVISKAAFNEGMNSFVFVFYRQAAASLLLLPIAFVLERKKYAIAAPWVAPEAVFPRLNWEHVRPESQLCKCDAHISDCSLCNKQLHPCDNLLPGTAVGVTLLYAPPIKCSVYLNSSTR